MFGMENKKRDETPENENSPFFDLESKVKDLSFYNNVNDNISQKMATLKASLRQGEAKEEYERLGIVLQGYMALQHVLKKTHQQYKK